MGKTEVSNGQECQDVVPARRGDVPSDLSSGTVNFAGIDDSPLRALEDRIRSINPNAPIIRTNFSKVDPKELLNISAFSLENVLAKEPDFLQSDGTEHVHDATISSVALKFPGLELNVNKLDAWIGSLMQELGTELFRYKGVLAVKGSREKFIFQGVHMMFSGGLASAAEETLRFKVGDKVQASVRGWVNAIVIKTWDEGNCYRLELQDQRKTNVWGPIDSPSFVKEGWNNSKS